MLLARIISTVFQVLKGRGSAGNVVRDFFAIIEAAAQRLASGGSRSEFVETLTRSLKSMGEEAYYEGAGAAYAPEDSDDMLIDQWLEVQEAHVENLADAIKREGMTPLIDNRLRLWAASLGVIGAVGYMQGNRNRKARWVKGWTEKGCDTCNGLDGKVATLGWFLDKGYIPNQPGSATLKCKGFKCGCKIVDVETGRRLLPLVRVL